MTVVTLLIVLALVLFSVQAFKYKDLTAGGLALLSLAALLSGGHIPALT